MKDLNIILLALGTPVIFLLFGIAVTIGGVIGVLFYVFGEMSRPDARGSISIKKHMRVWMYDLLGPKVYRWCGIVSFGFTTLLGIVFMIIGVVGLSGGSSHRHYSSRPNRPAQKQPHTPTTGKNTPSQKPNGPVISDKLGRMEGSPFFESAPEGSLLVGIQVSYATKGDYDVISSIQPLFCDDFGTYTKGNVYGIET
ncbi:MAG: hypothetical protein PVH19_04345, partial [Planctomycetia bacterium]